jgi:Flp pilus assembly protein TadG
MIRGKLQQRGRFWRNRRGATAIEFALLALPLIMLIFASLQTGIIFFMDQALQTTTQKSARQLLTGAAQTSGMTQQGFKNAVCANLPSEFACAKVMVDVQSSSTFSSANTATMTPAQVAANQSANTWSYSPGNAGDIVIVRVMYSWPVLGGVLALGLANQSNGGHLMIATSVFKNEPYQ